MAIGVLGGIAQRVAEKVRGRWRRRARRKRGMRAGQIETETALHGDNEGGGWLAGIVDGGVGVDVKPGARARLRGGDDTGGFAMAGVGKAGVEGVGSID